MGQNQEQRKWTVVEFFNNGLEEDSQTQNTSISTVPVKWLSFFDGTHVCKWPRTNIRKHIMRASSPEESWEYFEVLKLLEQPVTYEEAIKFEKEKEESENETAGNALETDKRKRKKKKDLEYLYSSHEEDHNMPKPHKIALKQNQFDDDVSEADTASFKSSELMPPPPPPPITALTKDMENNHNQHEEGGEIMIMESISNTTSDQNNYVSVATYEDSVIEDVHASDTFPAHIIEKLDRIIKQNIENRIMLERLLQHLSSEGLNCSYYRKCETVPTKPFGKFANFMKYDQALKESEHMRKDLKTVFSIMGGFTAKENIVRGLRKLLSDKLARKCSLLGRKGNFELRNMEWLKILKDAVQNKYQVSDKEFEITIMNWLRQANTRYTREKKKDEQK